MLRQGIIDKLNSDIVSINETHLEGEESLRNTNENYEWYGYNRQYKNVNAKKIKGGVGLWVKKALFHDYKISEMYKEVEGILSLLFEDKLSGYTFVVF